MRKNEQEIAGSAAKSEDTITQPLSGTESGRNITQRAEGMYVFNREDISTWAGLQGQKPLTGPKDHVFEDQVSGIGVGTMLVMPPISAWLGLTPLTTTILVGLSLMTLMSLYRRYEYSRPGRMDRSA